MANVNVLNVEVKDNPSTFKAPFQFEITFSCDEDLLDDLEWKIIYVGSAESEEHDQVLDSVLVGPVVAGKHKFLFTADCPDEAKIPEDEVVGVTVVLLTCSFRSQEFIRVGYYVNNEYEDSELKETPPPRPLYEKLARNILATCPRVTRFRINWGGDVTEEGAQGQENVPPEAALMPPPAEGKLPPPMDTDSNLAPEPPQTMSGYVLGSTENSSSGLEMRLSGMSLPGPPGPPCPPCPPAAAPQPEAMQI